MSNHDGEFYDTGWRPRSDVHRDEHGRPHDHPGLQEDVSLGVHAGRALAMHELLVEKGVILGTLDRMEEEIGVYEEVIRRFEKAEVLILRQQVAKALVNKGVALGTLGRLEEVIEICDEVVTCFQEAEELELQDQVAGALVNKGVALGSLDRQKEATAVYDEVISLFKGEAELLHQVDRARQLSADLQKPKKD